MGGRGPLRVMVVASEALPYAKTGGLADVVAALSRALARRECEIHLFHPLYRAVKNRFNDLEHLGDVLHADGTGTPRRIGIYRHRPFPGITACLISEPSLFDREGIYGGRDGDYGDNDLRFAVFCRAALAAAQRMRLDPHVIHCHDWQSALVPVYLRHRPDCGPALKDVPVLLTIHNLAYQGLFPRRSLRALDLPDRLFHLEGLEFYGKVNVLKGGILCADRIGTVSPRYSREIRTPEFGAGLHGVLRARGGDLVGILNGIDYEVWNPATDPHLPSRYSADDLGGKADCKAALLAEFGLDGGSDAPLLATITRLVDQKGLDIALPALPDLLDLGFRYILLGTGSSGYAEKFTSLARAHSGRMSVRIAYDEALSHLIEAGADFYLMPSRFEPCGLNQMYSLRYGTIPIVRAVGGLDDTVTAFDAASGEGNGFKFSDYSSEALRLKALEAFGVYRRRESMSRVVANAMGADFSWEHSAGLYLDLYREMISTAGGGRR